MLPSNVIAILRKKVKIEIFAFGSNSVMSYLKTGAISDFTILAIILTPYGLSEKEKKFGKMQEKILTVGCNSRCARGMALKIILKLFSNDEVASET